MTGEYVCILPSEKNYGEKNLLHAQLELLDSLKRFEVFRKLRGEEFMLKIALKTKVESMIEELKKIEGFLPKAEYRIGESNFEEFKGEEKEVHGLEDEAEEIRRKLAKLQRELF